MSHSLEALQSREQGQVLDTVAEIRKCGLDTILDLPQLVVCGDQSAGKSSVLEALTEIPFPRSDELCTRFATEIILRRSSIESITIKIIPDDTRNESEKKSIGAFKESITDFGQLPEIMENAKAAMGFGSGGDASRAFARDVLSIEIEGPKRPQLTVVDLPGLIQNETKGVTKADVDLVREITDHYISQSRTICLAVVSATNDYANQGILSRVREVDPQGERTLGIITKPDRLPAGSPTESAYIKLALNEDVFFKLGWHVVKNRSFEEGTSSFEERNASERSYFKRSNFKSLPKENVGIDTLRVRLCNLLFEHVKRELPKLNNDLNEALEAAESELGALGVDRSTAEDCKLYLSELSLEFHKACSAAVEGNYKGPLFKYDPNEAFSSSSPSAIRRLRALIQQLNAGFSETAHRDGHTYAIEESGDIEGECIDITKDIPKPANLPVKLTRSEALCWVKKIEICNHGQELSGTFNPLLIAELFWQQSVRWKELASQHLDEVADICSQFLQDLLDDMCPKDIVPRLWSGHFEDALKARKHAGSEEIARIMKDHDGYPINYNKQYTEVIKSRNDKRERSSSDVATSRTPVPDDDYNEQLLTSKIDNRNRNSNKDMEVHTCENALDGLDAIYEVSRYKTFYYKFFQALTDSWSSST